MDSTVNMRDPNTTDSRIYIGHLNESITKEILEFKFSMYGKIQGFLRTQPGFCFIQYDQPSSAANAITNEDGSVLNNNRILVKSAAMKKAKELKNSSSLSESMESEDTMQIPESLNKSMNNTIECNLIINFDFRIFFGRQ